MCNFLSIFVDLILFRQRVTTPMTYNEVDLTFNISIKRAKFVGFVQ